MSWHKPANFREWVLILDRHKKKMFFPAVLVATGVILVGSQYPEREYRAEGKVERKNDLVMTANGGGGLANLQLSLQRQARDETLKGRRAIEQLVQDLNLTKDFPRFEASVDKPVAELTPEGKIQEYDLVTKIKDKLGVYNQVQSMEMDQTVINYIDSDPELAARIVNQAIDNYVVNFTNEMSDRLVKTQSFFDRQAKDYKAQTQKLAEEKGKFEREHKDILPDDPASVDTQLREKRAKLGRVTEDLDKAKAKLKSTQEWYDRQPQFLVRHAVIPNPRYQALQKEREELQKDFENRKLNGTKLEHPAMKKILVRLAQIDAQMAPMPATLPGSEEREPNSNLIAVEFGLKEIAGEVKGLEDMKKDLIREVDGLDQTNRNFYSIRNTYQGIVAAYNDAKDQQKFWEDSLRRTTVAVTTELEQHGARITVLQRAQAMARPAKPTLADILLVAIAAAAATSLTLVVLAELLDRSYRSLDQAVDDLKLPLLGAVNEIITPPVAARQRVLGYGVFPLCALALLLVLGASLFVTGLSLRDPQKFDTLSKRPLSYVRTELLGRSEAPK